jgi:hypothetical protein
LQFQQEAGQMVMTERVAISTRSWTDGNDRRRYRLGHCLVVTTTTTTITTTE